VGVYNFNRERWLDGSHAGGPFHHKGVDNLLLKRIIGNEGMGVKDKAFLEGRLAGLAQRERIHFHRMIDS
jgi:hypothetical protein